MTLVFNLLFKKMVLLELRKTMIKKGSLKKKYLNSPGTEIFPFSYFAFTLFKLIRLIEDFKSIYIIQKTRIHGLDFGYESFYKNHHMTL